VLRDYLVVTRGVDPVALEQARMAHMTRGVRSPDNWNGFMINVAYVTFQELATRVSHRNTGRVCDDVIADRMLQRVAADENLHMIFYRNLCAAGLDLAPDQAMAAITQILTNFVMPGYGMPNFRRNGVLMAKHGIYDLRQHLEEVVQPVLKKWNIFERTDFGARGEQAREELGLFLEKLSMDVVKFEEQRDRLFAREAARGILQPV
jgi:acyl-[acyl-carrier-protein] desaturase